MFISPLIGSQLYTQFGPRKGCDYVAAADVSIGILLAIFNCGIFVFQENKRFKRALYK